MPRGPRHPVFRMVISPRSGPEGTLNDLLQFQVWLPFACFPVARGPILWTGAGSSGGNRRDTWYTR
jgi:hypothetical protein